MNGKERVLATLERRPVDRDAGPGTYLVHAVTRRVASGDRFSTEATGCTRTAGGVCTPDCTGTE